MPWLTLDFNDRWRKEYLSNICGVSGIPKLTLLDGDSGYVICDDARNYLQLHDIKGEYFPWDGRERHSSNHSSCVIL